MTPRAPDPLARELRTMLARLDSANGSMGRDRRTDIMRRLLDAEPDSSAMLRLAAHAYTYARELRELENRAERIAAGQLSLEDAPP